MLSNLQANYDSEPCFDQQKNCEKSTGDWNFIEALTNPSYRYKELRDQPKQVYLHPHAKSSTSLSTTSLEMCTECLGSETGNNIDPKTEEFLVFEKQSPNRIKKSKKIRQTNSFPPPLTSISGSDGVEVKTRREGGRLMIMAYSNFSSCVSCFEAECENGRLRLSFAKEDRHELSGNEEVKDENEDSLHGCLWGESVREDGGVVGGKLGGGEWSSSSRCNGDGSGNKRLPSLQFCVAIS